MLTPSSVHIPAAMGGLSIRGTDKKWKNLIISDIITYAKLKGISFVEAYKQVVSSIYSGKESK